MLEINRLHIVTQEAGGRSHLSVVEEACAGGARWIQLRIKDLGYNEWLEQARHARVLCRRYGATLIVNDNVVVAREAGADGVHLGRMDMDPVRARAILGQEAIIGGTANTREDIERLCAARVDYIGLGPFRETKTKSNLSPILGLDGIRRALTPARAAGIPVIVIGGVRVEDVSQILELGVHGVAVSGAIVAAEDCGSSVLRFLEAVQRAAGSCEGSEEV